MPSAYDRLYWYGPGGQVLAESALDGTITSEYIYFGHMRIARRDVATGNVYYFLFDRLGTGRVLTNASGTVVEESDFYPFGSERVITDALNNQYKFTQHERDTESGLDHTLYRQYTSTTARWLSADLRRGNARNPQSWNRYTYVFNNPTNGIDPLGLYCIIGGQFYPDGSPECPEGEGGITVVAEPLDNVPETWSLLPRIQPPNWDAYDWGAYTQEESDSLRQQWEMENNAKVLLDPDSAEILLIVYGNTGALTRPSTAAIWYGGSTLAALVAMGSVAAVPVVAPALLDARTRCLQNPRCVPGVADLISGYLLEGPPPPTAEGVLGWFLGKADEIYDVMKRGLKP